MIQASSELSAAVRNRAPSIVIRRYQPEDATAFRALNEAWITRYFALEEEDRRTLEHPEEHVLAPGGHIFMVFADQEPVGCCALIAATGEPDVYELAKMAVAEELRGQGIGRKLIVHVLEQARLLGARRLTLESNSVLANAVHLYESVGFRHLPPARVGHSPYARADIHMEMVFAGD
jgi:GNAT superfamily N-acetyltransferase